MKVKRIALATTVAVVSTAVALVGAAATDAGPKPGLVPGTWVGTGVIKGSASDGDMTTTFSGKLGFRIKVAKDLWVHGTGSWAKTMAGRGPTTVSKLTGIGVMEFGGRSPDVDFVYTEEVEGTIMDGHGMTFPIKFVRGEDELAASRLVIKRARTCTASGIIPTIGESGVKITWTAKRLGCNA